MPLTALKPSQIRKIAANSLVGNATGAEARGTSLSVSQVRTLLGLGTTDSPTFNTVTATTSVLTPLLNNTNAAALTLGNSTYGVTVPGAIASSGGMVVNGATDSANSVTTGNGAGATIAYLSSAFGHLAFNAKYNGSAYICGQTGYGLSALYVNSTGTLQFNALPSATAGGSYGAGTTIASLTRAGLFTVADASVTGTVQVGNATADGTGAKLFVETGIYTPGFLWSTGYARCAALTTTGDISMSKTSAQGYIRAYWTDATKNAAMYHDGTHARQSSSSGGLAYHSNNGDYYFDASGSGQTAALKMYNSSGSQTATVGSSGSAGLFSGNGEVHVGATGNLRLTPSSGITSCFLSGTQSFFRVVESAGAKYTQLTNDGTNGILSTSSGALVLSPANSLIPIGGITSAYPALKRATTYLDAKLGDDSAYTGIRASSFTAYASDNTQYVAMYQDVGSARIAGPYGNFWIQTPGSFNVWGGGGSIKIYSPNSTQTTVLSHDNTNGIISTSSGNLNLVPTGGTVAVTGAMTTTGDITLNKTSGIGYLRVNQFDDANKYIRIYSSAANEQTIQATQSLVLIPGSTGIVQVFTSGVQCKVRHYSPTAAYYMDTFHDGTNGILSTSSGNLNLTPAGGTVAVTGGITASGGATITGGGVSSTGGLKVGSYGASIGGIWNSTLTPSTSNYALAATATTSHLNATTSVSLAISGTDVLYSTATGMSVTQPLTITGFNPGFVTKVADYTLTSSDHTVCVTANSVTVTLETAVGCAGREHEIINTGAGTVTLNTTSAQTISGSASGALTLAQWKSIRVKSDGSNWIIMSQIT